MANFPHRDHNNMHNQHNISLTKELLCTNRLRGTWLNKNYQSRNTHCSKRVDSGHTTAGISDGVWKGTLHSILAFLHMACVMISMRSTGATEAIRVDWIHHWCVYVACSVQKHNITYTESGPWRELARIRRQIELDYWFKWLLYCWNWQAFIS